MGSARVNSVHAMYLSVLDEYERAHARSCLCRDVVCLSAPRLLYVIARNKVLCDTEYSTDSLAESMTPS